MSLLLSAAVDSDYEWIRFHLIGQPSADEWAAIGEIVEWICRPATPESVVAAATRCLTVTKAHAHDQTDIQAMLGIFADELQRFPEDVVVSAFRKFARREKFWPSFAEILDDCQRMARWRYSLRTIFAEGSQT
jgi:hypothetical protein